MSNVPSGSRATGSSSQPARPGSGPHDTPTGSGNLPPRDDQLTVISNKPPIPAEPMSDSVARIVQGKILPGDQLGHFELVEYIGGGGMGRVFRAIDKRLGRTVAIKVLTPEHAADKDAVQRFQNEAQATARMDHQNIARVHYVGEDRDLHFIALEFVEGVNIRNLVENNGPLPPAEAISYTLQIAEALAHSDERNIVHRDIKPSNVLITPEGQVKLIDMGLARSTSRDSSGGDLTASGVTLGTFDYISPEQARDPRNADIRSDLYSLGCALYYMLSGRPPFPEGTVLQKLLQHQGDAPPDIREFCPELSDEFARVLRKMLEKNPRRRYATPNELTADLLVLAERAGLHRSMSGGRLWTVPAKPVTSTLHRHFPWIVSVAALICIVLALDFLWSLDSTEGFGNSPNPSPSAEDEARVPPPTGQPAMPEPPGREFSTTSGALGGGGAFTSGSDPFEGFLASRFGSEDMGFGPVGGGVDFGPVGGSAAGDRSPWGLNLEEYGLWNHSADSPSLAVEPKTTGAVAEPTGKRSGLLVVKDNPEGENEFASLNAACGAAENGYEIKLCYDGRRIERPINLADLKVTIHPGEGYKPIVVFQPGTDDVDPVKYPRSMFTVTAGQLRLIDVALELRVPREIPADNWSLFETRGAQSIRLQNCSLSISNATDQLLAYHEVAFVRIKPAPGFTAAMAESESVATPLADIELVDCIVRGEAEFLRVEGLQPVRLGWDNGLLVTTERLLSAHGSQEAAGPEETLNIDLRHVTVVALGGLCRLTVDDYLAPHQLTTEIHCADSIIVLGSGAALIEQEGECGVDDFRQRLYWFGDRIFYENVEDYWRISHPDPEILPESMAFDVWQGYWGSEDENLPVCNEVVWRQLPDATVPLHAHTAVDYQLRESSQANPNPARGAASDGRDAGLQADRLPQLPAFEPTDMPQPVDRQPPAESTPREASTTAGRAFRGPR